LKIGLFFFVVLPSVCTNITASRKDEDERGARWIDGARGKQEWTCRERKLSPVPVCPE